MADATYTAVDLSRLPAPTVVQQLDFETVYTQMAARVTARLAARNPPVFWAATNEADPAVAVLQECAYQVIVERGRANDAAKAVMAAYATGADQDNLFALLGATRLTITPADPATGAEAVMESDADFRSRAVIAPEGYSVAGPEGAYIFHARSASSAVLDASATSPTPGQVLVTLLGRDGDGSVSAEIVETVSNYLTADEIRPLDDEVIVQSAEIVGYEIEAALYTFSGPDPALVIAQAQTSLTDYIATTRALGVDVTRAGIIAALKVAGMQNVKLAQPADDIAISRTQAAFCTSVTLNSSGIGE